MALPTMGRLPSGSRDLVGDAAGLLRGGEAAGSALLASRRVELGSELGLGGGDDAAERLQRSDRLDESRIVQPAR